MSLEQHKHRGVVEYRHSSVYKISLQKCEPQLDLNVHLCPCHLQQPHINAQGGQNSRLSIWWQAWYYNWNETWIVFFLKKSAHSEISGSSQKTLGGWSGLCDAIVSPKIYECHLIICRLLRRRFSWRDGTTAMLRCCKVLCLHVLTSSKSETWWRISSHYSSQK